MMPNLMSPAETLLTTVSALFIIPFIFGFVFKAPKLVVLGFLAVIFIFSDSTWGELQVDNNIYSRGVGMFYFSLLNLILFVSGVAALCKRLANRNYPELAPPLSKYFVAFVVLLAAHIVIGLMLGIDLNIILGYRGIINIFNMMIFMYLIIMSFKDESDIRNLLIAIIALAGIRALFGLVRYVWMGGDSANPYRNFEGMDIKIFFFDIADNFVASLAAFCAAWLLTAPGVRLSLFKRALLLAFMGLEIAAVALSFRRSSLLGMALMFALIVFRIPPRKRLVFGLFTIGLVAGMAVIMFEHRLEFASNGNSVLSSLIYDVDPNKNLSENRFYELYAAAKSVGTDNLLFGLGTWGSFEGDDRRLAYHFGAYDFVHSGFGHMILKTGLVGLVLFCCLLAAYVSFYFRHRNYLTGTARLLADAGFGGLLFWVPTLLIGTPIIEFRTMLLFGLTLALPFVAVGLENYKARTWNYYYAAA